jgi:hypothetical protein
MPPVPTLREMHKKHFTTTSNNKSSDKHALEASVHPPIIGMPITPDVIMKWKVSYTEDNLKLYLMGTLAPLQNLW